MITASVLAKQTDLPVYTVRHYTKIGLLKPKRNTSNGYKVYDSSDVSLLRFISNAKDLGFTLKEISQIISEAEKGKSPCPLVRDLIDQRIAETDQKIKQLRSLRKRMHNAKSQWDKMKDGVPNGHSVCRLIETFGETKPV